MNWDDLQAFLAVARTGSLRRASLELAVSQPTVARRIRALEEDLGLPLFDRDRDGHRLTAEGAELLPEVRAVETSALRVERRARDKISGLAETVRVEAMEWPAALLARGLGTIPDGPRVELVLSGDTIAQAARVPEIVVRHGMPSTGDGLIWRIGSIACAVYGQEPFSDGRALPLDRADLAALPWLTFIAEQQHYSVMNWITGLIGDRPAAARMSRSDQMAAAVAAGAGVAVLPCFLGNGLPGVRRLSPEIAELRADYWVVARPELSGNPSVRSVAGWIATCFHAAQFEKA